jgi:CubicO group peptidase (beta-lactamase class C family)
MRSYLSLFAASLAAASLAAASLAAVVLDPAPAFAAPSVTVSSTVAPARFLTPAACNPVTSADLAGFFDSVVPARLQRDHVPGAVVSVVDHDTQLFAKGYGLADTARNVAFDPDRSLVRIASISKLFTYTAVMQQVQAGRIDLNADVNTYLTAFKVPATFPEPVTMQDLMDHTAGFEDRVIRDGARTAADVPPLGQYLADNMPARIRPPGVVYAYSNYGAALAGYIVSQVSGEPYDAYIQRHLLDPLQMAHSTAAEPVPAALARDLAVSYNTDDGPARAIPFIFDPGAPDGSITTTASDLGHFMMANLNEGRYGSITILSPSTMDLMHTRSFADDPRLGGHAHGFIDKTINGHHVLMHDGGWEAFESVMILIPGCDLGLFLSTNATTGTESLAAVVNDFFDRFAPTPATPDVLDGPLRKAPLTPSAPTAGFYAPTRHNESTVEKLLVLLGPVRLTVAADGTVHFLGKQWRAEADGRYAALDGSDHLVFLTGPDGQRYVGTDNTSAQLLGPASRLTVNLWVLAFIAVVGLSGLVMLLAAGVRRVRHRSSSTTRTWRVARLLGSGAAVVGLVFLVLLLAELLGDTSDFLYGVPARFAAILVLPLVVLGMAATSVGATVASWRSSGPGLVARSHQVVVLVGLVALTWFLWQWNLIGWQF